MTNSRCLICCYDPLRGAQVYWTGVHWSRNAADGATFATAGLARSAISRLPAPALLRHATTPFPIPLVMEPA